MGKLFLYALSLGSQPIDLNVNNYNNETPKNSLGNIDDRDHPLILP